MKVISLKIPDIKLIEPDSFDDERGFFFESFNQKKFNSLVGVPDIFVQDNHSKSKKGVLRGLHYQEEPFDQGKLVRVIKGKVFDVVVDIRKNSPTYNHWLAETLSESNKKQLWIPSGFAHGFLALEDDTEFLYKTTKYYSTEHERVIGYNDKKFNIEWPEVAGGFILGEKDLNAYKKSL
jgi:dTDP-4-dehydrorhamnose 3,5-epimerase